MPALRRLLGVGRELATFTGSMPSIAHNDDDEGVDEALSAPEISAATSSCGVYCVISDSCVASSSRAHNASPNTWSVLMVAKHRNREASLGLLEPTGASRVMCKQKPCFHMSGKPTTTAASRQREAASRSYLQKRHATRLTKAASRSRNKQSGKPHAYHT